jgi:hypothetical protein
MIILNNLWRYAEMEMPDGFVPAELVPIAIICMLTGSAPSSLSFYENLAGVLDKKFKGNEFSLRPLTKEELQAKVFLYCFVTIWLDSGKDPQNPDINNPQKRHLLSTHPETGESFLSMLNSWKDRHPPSLKFSDDGKVSVVYEEPILSSPPSSGSLNYSGLFGSGKKPTSPRDIALYWLVRLLDSPGAHCLARCANPSCEKFFLYKKPQGQLKKGTYCNSCKTSYFSEMAKSRRAAEKAKLVGAAAAVWRDKHDVSIKHSDWVAARINQQLGLKIDHKTGTDHRKTGKWVKQNAGAIEAYLADNPI